MGLADHLVKRAWPQLVGERARGVVIDGVGGEEIGHGDILSD
jgi:hypothetical protein